MRWIVMSSLLPEIPVSGSLILLIGIKNSRLSLLKPLILDNFMSAAFLFSCKMIPIYYKGIILCPKPYPNR